MSGCWQDAAHVRFAKGQAIDSKLQMSSKIYSSIEPTCIDIDTHDDVEGSEYLLHKQNVCLSELRYGNY